MLASCSGALSTNHTLSIIISNGHKTSLYRNQTATVTMNKYYSIGAVAAILTTAADAQYLLRKRHIVPQDNSDLTWKDGRDRLSFRGAQYRWLQDEVVKSMSMSMSMSMVSAVEDAATTDATPQELYYSLSWADLPSHIQVAYEELGYTETLWDEDGDARTDSMKWADLSEAEQAAALAIGYTQELWDADVVSTLDEPVIVSNLLILLSSQSDLLFDLAHITCHLTSNYLSRLKTMKRLLRLRRSFTTALLGLTSPLISKPTTQRWDTPNHSGTAMAMRLWRV